MYSDEYGTPDPPSDGMGGSISPTPPTPAQPPTPPIGRPPQPPKPPGRSPSRSPARSPPPPGSPPGPPPSPPQRPEGGRYEPPSDPEGEETPPYLFNYYEPLSRMWMGRDRYYAMLEAGMDPETFEEGMMIPDPEEDPNEGPLPGEERTYIEEYHRERLARGAEIQKHLELGRAKVRLQGIQDREARAFELHLQRLKDEVQAKYEERAARREAEPTEQCAFVDESGKRCPVLCNVEIMRRRKFPDRCVYHSFKGGD
ncbi:ADP-D-ribose binding [Ciborinia camelliae]|nr:ADP-D-ribose binding [Ciborinia camelliae]